ncbi:MAG TPA: hypothetical protein VGV40_06980 [Solirubrobacteraceae bacterium]|nr:hypothetical protein [Solirubrobacteraceae bacterium]
MPHGQGTIGVVDVTPDPQRPLAGDPTGNQSGEEIVLGRARGEERSPGEYHGHITILSLFGNEILGIDTMEGQSRSGPLDAAQRQVLDQLCSSSGGQTCLNVLRADSNTTDSGSFNFFQIASAVVGGNQGLSVRAATSEGNVFRSDQAGNPVATGACQTGFGGSEAANVMAGGGAVADALTASSRTIACRNMAAVVEVAGRVLGLGVLSGLVDANLGGVLPLQQQGGVPLPAPGCGDGTANVETGVPTLLPIICNATDVEGTQAASPYAVREALTLFALRTGDNATLKVTASAAESLAQAPPEDGAPPVTPRQDDDDDDGDDGDAADEGDEGDAGDDQGPGDAGDAGPSGADSGPGGRGARGDAAECADGIDNDGDGRIDFPNDPDCESRQDDSEAGARVAGLPFSGADSVGPAVGGLMLLVGGLLLRRRARAGGAEG